MNNGRIIIAAICLILGTGCIFKKTGNGPVPEQKLNVEQHTKVILKLSGPANWEDGRHKVAAALLKLPYVIDVCVSNKYYGSVFIHISPNSSFNIKELQKACHSAGYDVIRAAEISW